jgi:GR25 family glycosyltransferase involved in LPS biosynthesis
MSSYVNEKCSFYCLSYKNEERKANVLNKFNELNINVEFYEGVGFDDNRLSIPLIHKDELKNIWSCMYGHLDMINKFVNETDKEYGVFCEDDIYLDKNLANDFPMIIEDFKTMKLDILLLGYLTRRKIEDFHYMFSIKDESNHTNNLRKYHNYSDDLWGTQMYMLSKSQAIKILEKYYNGYAEKSLTTFDMKPFSADWTITKEGNRALVYPMYAVEDGGTRRTDNAQKEFHTASFLFNYDSTKFI